LRTAGITAFFLLTATTMDSLNWSMTHGRYINKAPTLR
jgi:hypothetical protein